MLWQNVLRTFVGEFRVQSHIYRDNEKCTFPGIQTGALVNNGRGVMAQYIANSAEADPVRMQGMLTYNSSRDRFECTWAGSNVDGIVYYHRQLKNEKLVLSQVTSDSERRVMTTEFLDDDHFTVLLNPGMTFPDYQSVSEFSRI
ncbi:DUF1579 family protein [Endozoicomonas sp.]|uniref:DUF1579 family protein n=1 Tax=Endozoicomonas sp. TaxID=1892382 RepID=UPI003AF7C337